MSSVSPLSSNLSLDTTDFKLAIASANRELRVLETGFRANAASLGDWSKTSDGLEMRIESLNKQIDVQGKKVNSLRVEYERVAKEKGADSRAAQELQIKLNSATEALGKMENELKDNEAALEGMGGEAQDAGKKTEELGKKEDETKEKSKQLSPALKAVGAAIAAIVTAAVAAVAALAGLVNKAIEAAGELVDLSEKTGLSTTQLQEMQYIGDQLGVGLETMTGSMAKLTRNMSTAREGTGAAAEAFKALGIDVTDSNGELRDSQTVYNEALAALGAMTNETERDATAMAIFGKSAQELNPLIKAGAWELANLRYESHEVGAVMSEETVSGLEAVGDSIASLKAGFEGTMGTLSGYLVPVLNNITGLAKDYMGEFAAIVSGSKGDLRVAGPQIGALLGKIINEMLKQLPNIIETGLGLVQGLITTIVGQLPALVSALMQMLPLLLQFGIDVLLALIQGITQALPGLIQQITDMIPLIVQILLDNLPLLVKASLELILALVQGLIEALPELIEYIPEIVTAIFDALVLAAPMILEAAYELVKTLIEGIGEMLATLKEQAPVIWGAIAEGFVALWESIKGVGGSIITKIWEGLEGSYEWLKKKVTDLFNGLVNGIKEILGIKSPSQVFEGLGVNMALGMGQGFEQTWNGVQRQIAGAMRGLEPALAVNVSGGPAANAGMAPVVQVQISGVQIASDMDVMRLAQRVVREIERRRMR
ncbi:MAG: phage tail protein [Anaerolineae bacterium]